MKLIRFEVNNYFNPKLVCGMFAFPPDLLDTGKLTPEERKYHNLLIEELHEPKIEIPVRFYFTESGYMKFKTLVDNTRRMMVEGVFYLQEDYLEIDENDERIVYKDEYQVGVK